MVLEFVVELVLLELAVELELVVDCGQLATWFARFCVVAGVPLELVAPFGVAELFEPGAEPAGLFAAGPGCGV